MTWRVVFTPKAERDFKRLPKADKQRIKDEMTDLAEEPYAQFYVKNLKGHRNAPIYSYRVGEYRIILTIENDVMVIFVIEVGDRSKVYRKY
ncbi:MAG TPA: type II toxin-antitoxin system RelE/ParE family toxin [Methanoculleus sp.]|nr:type II toxin-antitoxin system RelE/ParE family toxin [Methanoculleus sp.]